MAGFFRLGSFGLGARSAGGGAAPDYFADLNTALASSAKSAVWPVGTDYVFQDTSLTAVASHTDPVAIQFDSSKLGGDTPLTAIAAASEIVTNGDFSGGATGWSITGANVSIGSGKATWTGAGANERITQGSLTTTKFYYVSFDVTDYTSGTVYPLSGLNVVQPTAIGSYSCVVTNTSNIYIRSGGGGFTGSVDNISYKEVPGLTRYQNTTANRPLYKVSGSSEWLNYDGSNDRLTVTVTGSTSMTIVVGVKTSDTVFTLLSGDTAGEVLGVVDGTSSTDLGVGDIWIDGTRYQDGVNTRLQVQTALADGNWHRVEFREVDLSAWGLLQFGGNVPGNTNYFLGSMTAPVAIDAADLSGDYAAALAIAQNWVDAEFAGAPDLLAATYSASSNYDAYTGLDSGGAGVRDDVLTGAGTTSHATSNAGDEWIKMDFGSSKAITDLYIATIPSATYGWGPDYLNGAVIEWSNDDSSWTTGDTISGMTDGVVSTFAVNQTARYLRIRMAAANWLGVSELYAWGAA